MTEYRRTMAEGASFFFTVNCARRRGNTLLVDNVDLLRSAFRQVKNRHPFHIDAIVILPDHLHCIWTLPTGDSRYGVRWSLIKALFSRSCPPGEWRSRSRTARRERGIWQRRFWEHLIRDDKDYSQHIDYIHWNPVKHGWVKQVKDWPYSSFHDYVTRGIYSSEWGCKPETILDIVE